MLLHSVSGARMDRARATFASTPAADRAIVAAAATAPAPAPAGAAKPAGPADADKAADTAGPAAAEGEGEGGAKSGGSATGGLRIEGAAVTAAYMSEGAAAAAGPRVLRWMPAKLCEAVYGAGYRLLLRRSPGYDHAAPACRDRLPLAFPAHPPLRGLMARGDRLRPAPGDPPNEEAAAESGAAVRPAAAVRLLEAPRTTAAAVRPRSAVSQCRRGQCEGRAPSAAAVAQGSCAGAGAGSAESEIG